jgi:hypothetical protein
MLDWGITCQSNARCVQPRMQTYAPGVDIDAAAVLGAFKPLAVIHTALQVYPLPRRALPVRRARARQAAESKDARRRQRDAQGGGHGEEGGGGEAGAAKHSLQHREGAGGHVRGQEASQRECPVSRALSTQEEGAEGLLQESQSESESLLPPRDTASAP